jgi:LuxR family maltose regulon positive regulatory protein
MDAPILRTKLYIPQAEPGGLITRPRLIQRLNEGLTRKLTLISAPAGSGKTTLVSQWLHGARAGEQGAGEQRRFSPLPPLSPAQFAWLSLDEGDNDPVRFWTYVIAALETVQAGLGASTLPLLHSPQPVPLKWP